MAALQLNVDVVQVWSEGVSDFAALYMLRGITAGDTIDLSTHFRSIKRAAMVGVTVAGSATASNTGNVITIPAGPAVDAAMLLVYGVHA